MKRIQIVYLFALLLLVGCNQSAPSPMQLRIAPTVQGRATALDFEENDCIGLTVIRSSGAYVENQPLAYHGGCFINEPLVWYADHDAATLRAYYPYSVNGVGNRYEVESDQRNGLCTSDLLCAQRKEVSPTSEAVRMTFYHVMARLQIALTNETTATIQSVVLEGLHTMAILDWENLTASADANTPPKAITAYPTDAAGNYRAIVVPQSGTLDIRVTTAKQTYAKPFEADFQSGKSYSVALTLCDEGLAMTIAGDIQDWDDGDDLTPKEEESDDDSTTEDEPDQSLTIGEEHYTVCQIGGLRWMAENLRTLPAGQSVGNHIYYPRNAQTNQGDASLVATLGYLYDYETAVALCPEGWHLPTAEELALLVAAPASFFTEAGLYARLSEGGIYQASNYLLGEISADDTSKCHVLKFTSEGYETLKTHRRDYGYSVRYVANR